MNKYALDKFYSYNLVHKILILSTLLVLITYPTGPFLPDFFLTITSLIFLSISIKKKLKKYYSNFFTVFFLLFFLFTILNSLFAIEPMISLKSSAFYPRFFLFSLSLWYLLDYDDFFKKIFFIVSFFILMFINLDTILQYVTGEDIFKFESKNHRLSGPFGDELIVGSFIAKFLPVVLSLYFLINKKMSNSILILITISLIVTFLSGERTSTFYVFTFVLIYSIFISQLINKKKILLLFLTVFFMISAVVAVDKSRFERMIIYPVCAMNVNLLSVIDCPKYQFQDYNKYVGDDGEKFDRFILFSEAHEGHFTSAYKMFLDSPIFGKGNKMFRYHCGDKKFKNKHSCTTHPHNLLLQILAELGFIGLIFFVIIIFNIYRNFYRLLTNKIKIEKNKKLAFLSVNLLIIQLFFILLPSGQIFNNYLSILYYLPLGIYLSLYNAHYNGK